MTDSEILNLLKEALAEVAPAKAKEMEDLSLECTIQELDLDSVSTMEMVGFLEEKCDKIFPDEELAKVNRLADLASLMRGERVSAA